jgi:hypothetical protein
MVLVVGARGTTRIPSMRKLQKIVEFPITKIKNTFKQINIIATQYVHSIDEDSRIDKPTLSFKTYHKEINTQPARNYPPPPKRKKEKKKKRKKSNALTC